MVSVSRSNFRSASGFVNHASVGSAHQSRGPGALSITRKSQESLLLEKASNLGQRRLRSTACGGQRVPSHILYLKARLPLCNVASYHDFEDSSAYPSWSLPSTRYGLSARLRSRRNIVPLPAHV